MFAACVGGGGLVNRKRLLFGSFFSVLVLAGGLLAVVPVLARADRTVAALSGKPPLATARELAMATGKKELIPEKTTPTSQTWANPDGSYTTELTVAPSRAKVGGEWQPVDTTLRPSGTLVVPKVSAAALAFSGGGGTLLARLGDPGAAFELHWPRALPKPVLSGDQATYPEVFPGADLVMRATRQGYSETLVVKNREAAQNPAVRQVRFTVVTDGLTAAVGRHGSLDLVDKGGKVVWTSPQPSIWDATGRTPVATAMTPRSPVSRSVTGAFGLSAGTSLTVRTPAKFLDDPGTTYPVAIDPDFGAPLVGWAEVYGYPGDLTGQAYWNGDGDGVAKVGYSDWDAVNGVPSAHPRVLVRSYFQFDVGGLVGADILDAEFNLRESYAPSCQARVVELHTTGQISGGTTWNNQPWDGGPVTDGGHPSPNVAHGYSAGCPPEPVGFWAKRAVTDGLACGCHLATVMLRAQDESLNHAAALSWKKFDTNPSLVVTYNRHPKAPTNVYADVPLNPKLPCSQTVDASSTNTTSKLRLHATVSDPDGDNVNALFEWFYWNGATIGNSGWTPLQANSSEFTATIPDSLLVDGKTLGYRVLAGDGQSTSDTWSPSCEITIDRTKPAAPTLASDLYQGYDPTTEDGTVSGGIGQTGQFTFTAGGDPDVTGFSYATTEHPTPVYVPVATGTNRAVVGITPSRQGPFDLTVNTVDRAGNQSAIATKMHFFSGGGSVPDGYWRLDGTTGELTAPEWTGRHTGKLNGAASWVTGRAGDGVQLDGTAAYVSTAGGPVVDTDNSFTVSAWAKLDRIGGYPTLLSEDGLHMAGFKLQATADAHWAFAMYASDVDGSAVDRAVSSAAATPGQWTHLVGEYDAGSKQLRIYVDGTLSGSAAHTSTWAATGVVTIGRSMSKSAPSDYFPGAIDEVKVYNRLLSDTDNTGDGGRGVFGEVHALADGPVREEGFWPLDDGSGTAATEISGNYRVGRLGANVSWSAGTVGTGSAAFTGSPTGIDSGGPIVSAAQSFTVSARVRVDTTAFGNPIRDVLSQDGPSASGSYSSDFELAYAGGSSTWQFAVNGAGTLTAAMPLQSNEWTAVTAVYDAPAKQLRLYVNGVRQAVLPVTGTASMQAAGSFVIGRGRAGTVTSRGWVGQIDDVHVYTGVLRDGAWQSDASVWPTDRFPNNQVLDEFNLPRTAPSTPYGQQIVRYIGHGGQRIATNGAIPPGYSLESGLGVTVAPGTAGTRMLYSCRTGSTDWFVSVDPACEGKTYLGQIGLVYTAAPAGVATRPLFRCHTTGAHTLSNAAGCNGGSWISDGDALGYALDRAVLVRYLSATQPVTDRSLTTAVPGDYRPTSTLGLLGAVGEAGTVPVTSCLRGADSFLSLDSACEGATVIGAAGSLWAAAPANGLALYRCRNDTTGAVFETTDGSCEGQLATTPVRLGYLLSKPW
jgi:hypothetical protein